MKVTIYRSPWAPAIDIMFWDEREGKIYAAKPVELEFVEVDRFSSNTPTLSIHGRLEKEFMKALAEELDRNGVKTEKDEKLAGTIEAMRSHLSDLRQLLKLK